jgi:purine-binding chemotaxis protein CheW
VESDNPSIMLLCAVGPQLCALPIGQIVETMRPLPVTPLPGAPHFVQGVAIIRGVPLPVLDVARLLGATEVPPTRFVTVHTGDRQVALAISGLLGIREVPAALLASLPPLLRDAGADLVTAIGALDTALMLVLDTARLAPAADWMALGVESRPA